MEKFFDESWFHAPVHAIGDEICLPPEEAMHIRKVLRLHSGTSINVSNGNGGVFLCTIQFNKNDVLLVTEALKVQESHPPKLNLILSLLKGRDLEDAAEGLCQLNVNAIHLVTSDHTQEFKGQNHTRLVERLRSKSLVGLKQAKKAWLTKIFEPIPINLWLEKYSSMPLVILHPGPDEMPQRIKNDFGVLTGPEGGFSGPELETLSTKGFYRMGLGETRIRSIHAPLLACGKLLGLGWL